MLSVRTVFVLAAVAVLATATWAGVWPVVCCYDEKTPLEVVDSNGPTVFRDIMVGTRLTIIIRSDEAVQFGGGLIMSQEDSAFGELQPRGTGDKWWNYPDSCRYEAGSDAQAWFVVDPFSVGVDFVNTFHGGDRRFRDAVPGDWFIVDYHALQTGSCEIGFYDYSLFPPDTPSDLFVPLETLLFHHVPTRDLNADRVVNLKDFAACASQAGASPQTDSNGLDAATDLDTNHRVDLDDLRLFSDFWLERTDAPLPAADPNQE